MFLETPSCVSQIPQIVKKCSSLNTIYEKRKISLNTIYPR